MKKLLSIALLLSFAALGNGTHCDTQVVYNLQRNTQSDYAPVNVKYDGELPAGEILTTERGDELSSFDADTYIYTATGSYHSGWFKIGAVVDKRTCDVIFKGYLAAE